MYVPSDAAKTLDKLIAVIDRLLDPVSGCPWDIKQTPQSIASNILEETYELLEGLSLNQAADVKEEAGDLIFLLVFLARLAQDRWQFNLEDIIGGAVDKMVSRHPHIFAQGPKLTNEQEVLAQWQKIKRKEGKGPLLSSVPRSLPALQRAHRISERVGRLGFDWKGPAEVKEAFKLEWLELEEALQAFQLEASPEAKLAVKHELGDVLFCLANYARHLGIPAEESLAEAADRFTRRFNHMEDHCADNNVDFESLNEQAWEGLWRQAKNKVG